MPSKCRNCLSAKQSAVEKSPSIARVLRHFVLVPCEICVVPYGHGKIAADWSDIPLANRYSTGVSLNIVRSYLSSVVSKQSLLTTRLATNAFARRFAPSNAVAGQPGPLLVIRWLQAEKKNHTKRYGSFF